MDSPPLQEEFVPPSVRARVFAALAVVLAVSLAALFVFWGQDKLLRWLSDPMVTQEVRAVRSASLAAAMIANMVMLCFGTAVWLGCMAQRIRTQGVFPPTGYPVLTKTPRLHGEAAQPKAQQHAVACGLVLLLEAIALGGAFYFLPLAETLQHLR